MRRFFSFLAWWPPTAESLKFDALAGMAAAPVTWPVAMESLPTGFALTRLAMPGGAQFIAHAIALAAMVGVAPHARHSDGTLRDAVAHSLPLGKRVVALRLDGELYVANVLHFEHAVLEAVTQRPEVQHLLVVGNGINQMDASDEELVRHLVEPLRQNGVHIAFSGLKPDPSLSPRER